jgi:Zn-finger nucleic acid-binding protein
MSGTTLICPKCAGAMRTYERSGVTVDQCGECRGIFLDRGELDHLIDAERSWHSEAPREPSYPPYRDERPGYDDHRYEDHDRRAYPRKRKKSFLDELFD